MTEIPHMSEDDTEARHDDDTERERQRERERKERKDSKAGKGERKSFIGTGFFWGLVIGLVLAALMIILAAQNTASVTVRFLGWEISTPLIVLILGSLLIGIILDEIAGAIYRRRRRRILNEREELKRLRSEVGDQ